MPRHPSPPPQNAYAAFCEEFDEDADVALPETRTVANVAAKRSKPDFSQVPGSYPVASPLDGASDSGYSSRTAATIGSADSVPSARSDPTVTERDVERARKQREKQRQQQQQQYYYQQQLQQQQKQQQQVEAEREKPRREKDRERDRQGRPSPEVVMPASSSHRNAGNSAQASRSRSKSTRRQSVSSSRHPPGVCWDCDQQAGFSHTPVDSRPADYSAYARQSSRYDMPPPPSPQISASSRYPPAYSQEIHSSSSRRRQSPRPQLYHESQRPVSYHAGMGPPDMNPKIQIPSAHPQQQYDYGPPLSASAYARGFNPAAFPQQQPGYSQGPPIPQPTPPPQQAPPQSPRYERSRAPSHSRPAEQRPRRSSIYGPPVVQYSPNPSAYQDVSSPERKPSRTYDYANSQKYYDRDEDFYLMPPPPAPKSKSPTKQVVTALPRRPSVRKSATTSSTPTAQRAHPFDMSDMRAQLPDPRVRHRDSRESPMMIPERRPSVNDNRPNVRSSSYHDSSRTPGARVLKEDERRRRTSVYGVERPRDLEQKQRDAEEYQAARASRATPLTADALARTGQRPESESGSSTNRSENSSRGSDSKTKSGSGVGSRPDDDNNSITMTIQGVKMSFNGDNRERRKINVRSGEEGALEFNIEGGRRAKKYLMSRSDSTSASGRKEIEDVRRVRDDYKTDRASRRSSRSTYNGRLLD